MAENMVVDDGCHTFSSNGPLGTIEELKLFNFMCHETFSIKFGQKINFIIGENGSGKSAILTGIVLGLGGRATMTSRGSSIKSFIKQGCSVAKIVVKICNYDGENTDNSYQYDLYGRSIIVERVLRDNGTSSYTLKSKADKVVSHAKEDLDKITNFFSMQINNPVCILNQEVSRNFLNSKDPALKYQFFMAATQLQDIYDSYQAAVEDNDKAKKTYASKEKHIPAIKSELAALEHRLELIEHCENMKTNLKKHKACLAWKLVDEEEQVVEKIKQEQNKMLDQIVSIDRREKKIQADIGKFKQEKIEAEERARNATVKKEEIMVKLDQINDVVSQLRSKKREKLSDYKMEEKRAAQTQRDIKNIESEIRQQEAANEDYNRKIEARNRQLERLASIDDKIKELEAEEHEKNAEVTALDRQIQPILNELESLKEDRDQVGRQLNGCKARKQNLERSGSNRLAVYGQNIMRLCQKIDEYDRRGAFKVKPYGPLGSYVTLKDESTGKAMQACFGKLAQRFACQNTSDMKILQELVRQVFNGVRERPPQIVMQPFSGYRYDISQNKVRGRHKSMLDYLSIADDYAFNVLVDLSQAETIAYIPDDGEATRLLVRTENVPENCTQAFTREGTVMYAATSRKPYRSYPYDRPNDGCIFSKDVKSEIDSLSNQISELEAQIKSIGAQGRAKNDEQAQLKRERDTMARALSKINNEKLELRREKVRIGTLPEPVMVETMSLKRELELTQKKLADQRELLAKSEEAFKEASAELEKKEAEYDALENEKNVLESDRNPMQRQVRDIDYKIALAERQITDCARERQETETARQEKDAEILQAEKVVETKIKEAKKLYKNREECRSRKDSNAIKVEIERLKRLIQERENEQGDPDEIRKEYEAKKKEFDRMNLDVKSVKELISTLDGSIEMRKKKFKRMRLNISQEVAIQFKNCLEMMDFKGELIIHHKAPNDTAEGQRKKHTLEILVNPKAKTSEHHCKDTRSLSGGERSFSTVAFLMALWEHCTTPFRILDEVDVFMDMVTRNVAMDTIMQSARNKGTQYIMLSPLPLIEEMDGVCIFKMPEPKR